MIDKKIAFRAAFQKVIIQLFKEKIPSPIHSANFGTHRTNRLPLWYKICGCVASPIQYINPGTFWGEPFGDSCFLDFIFGCPRSAIVCRQTPQFSSFTTSWRSSCGSPSRCGHKSLSGGNLAFFQSEGAMRFSPRRSVKEMVF